MAHSCTNLDCKNPNAAHVHTCRSNMLGDVNAFSYSPEFERIIKMSLANHKSKAAQAIRSRLDARDPNQEFKPDPSLQTRWHICEVNMLSSHLGTVCYSSCLHFCLAH